MDIKYPEIKVPLVGTDGNAFTVLGIVRRALARHGVPAADIEAYLDDATSGDYDHLLQVTMRTVDVL
jgi:hypothetical protein